MRGDFTAMSVDIRADHVVKKYGNNTVIPDLSVSIRQGEFFTLYSV